MPLTETGDGQGDPSASGDYSSSPVKFYIQPPKGQKYYITELKVLIVTTGTSIDYQGYGTGAGLDHPISFMLNDSITLYPLPIGNQGSWLLQFSDNDVKPLTSITAQIYTDNLNAVQPIILDGDENNSISIILNDDFSSRVVVQFFLIRGVKSSAYA